MAQLNALTEARVRKAVSILSGQANVRAAYVFGSQASGAAHSLSDLDVAVFMEGLSEWDMRQRARVIATVQKQVGDDVELHLFRAESLSNPPVASLVEHIVRHGVLVEPSDEKQAQTV